MLQIAFTLKRLHGTLALLLTLQCLWLVCVYMVSLTHATWEMIVSFRHYPSRTVFISSKGIILYVVLFHCFICMIIIFTAVTFYISICFWKWVKPYKLKISLLSVLAQSNPLIFSLILTIMTVSYCTWETTKHSLMQYRAQILQVEDKSSKVNWATAFNRTAWQLRPSGCMWIHLGACLLRQGVNFSQL